MQDPFNNWSIYYFLKATAVIFIGSEWLFIIVV